MTPRYLLFAGDTYYPAGGWEDFHLAFNSLEEAKDVGYKLLRVNWWHVVDLGNMEIVWSKD